MAKENPGQDFRLKNEDKIRNYLTEEIKQNELMSKGHKRVCRVINYIEHLLILASAFTRCVPICAFTSLGGVPVLQ